MRTAAALLAIATVAFGAGMRPRVRAITAFIDVDASHYNEQIRDAMRFLDKARGTFQASGFEVEGVRIATQPFPEYTRGLSRDKALAVLAGINELAGTLHFAPAIGPAMLNDDDDVSPVDLLIEVLSKPSHLNASLVMAAADGIHWKAIGQAARLIKTVGARSEHGEGNFNFAGIAMLGPNGPFFPGAYHLGSGRAFAVGLEGASVVEEIFARTRDPRQAQEQLSAALAAHMKDAESAAQKVATSAPGWTYAGIDPTPAPLGDVSIGRAIESFVGGPFGSSGTMTAAAIITRAVQSVPVKRTGYSGLMVPVLEDSVLARRWAEGAYSIDSLLAYSAVCAGGLDTVPLPGEVSEQRIARILGDVATLAYKWNKPLAARLIPVPGGKPGDRTQFGDSRMANTVLQPLKP
jgi:uncharacterized protein (UPF0210 family)